MISTLYPAAAVSRVQGLGFIGGPVYFLFAKVWLGPGVALVPWSCGHLVPWSSGPVVLWSFDIL